MTMEWRAIPGYEGKYIISEYGDVRRLNFTAVRLNRWGGSNSYTMIAMPMKSRSVDGRYLTMYLLQKPYPLHRLVALAFVPNPDNKPFINHKDCNSFNNHFSNLEWCTHQENMDHAKDNGLLNYVSAKKLTPELVKEIKLIPKTISSIEVAKKYPVNSRTIRAIRLNQTWKYV